MSRFPSPPAERTGRPPPLPSPWPAPESRRPKEARPQSCLLPQLEQRRSLPPRRLPSRSARGRGIHEAGTRGAQPPLPPPGPPRPLPRPRPPSKWPRRSGRAPRRPSASLLRLGPYCRSRTPWAWRAWAQGCFRRRRAPRRRRAGC